MNWQAKFKQQEKIENYVLLAVILILFALGLVDHRTHEPEIVREARGHPAMCTTDTDCMELDGARHTLSRENW